MDDIMDFPIVADVQLRLLLVVCVCVCLYVCIICEWLHGG